MSFVTEIQGLIEEGYNYDDILDTLVEVAPNMKGEIAGLINEGFNSEDIISTFLELPNEQEKPPSLNTAQQIGTGVGLGGLDFVNLLGLAEGALTSPLTYGLLNKDQRSQSLTPGQEARYNLESQPNISDKDFIALASEDAELLPYSRLPGGRKKLREAEKEIPQGGLTQEISRRIARSAPLLAFGLNPLLEGLAAEGTGLAGRKGAEALGFGETGQTIADILFGLYGGYKTGQKLAQKGANLAEKTPRIAQKAESGMQKQLTKAEILATPQKVQNDINNLSNQSIREYNDATAKLSQNTFEGSKFDARTLEKEIVSQTKDAAIDSISPPRTAEQSWNKIAEGVNKELSEQRSKYRNLYKSAEKEAQGLNYTFTKTAQEAENLLEKFSSLATKGRGQTEVEKALQTSLKDLGVSQKEGDVSKLLTEVLKKYKGTSIEAADLQKLLNGQAPIPVDRAMALKRSLSDIVNYEDLYPSIKDLLRPLIKTLKSETLEALDQRPLVKAAYQQAESQFAKTSNTFDKDAINFLRGKDAPETAANKFLVGSNLQYLKNAVGKNSDTWKIVESQILKEISKKSVDAGRDILKETAPYLSNDAQKIAKDLINMGDKLTSPGAQQLMRGKILESLQKASSTGERPEYALQLMKNPVGYQFTENLLKKSPKGRHFWKALEKQSIDDIFNSILDKNNAIDWNKAKNLFKEKQVETIIKSAVGEEGYKFMKNLETYGKNITQNLEQFSRKASPSLKEQFVSSTGLFLKSLLASFVGGKPALLGYLGLKVVPKMTKSIFYKMLSSPSIRNSIQKLSQPKYWKEAQFLPILHKLNREIEEEN